MTATDGSVGPNAKSAASAPRGGLVLDFESGAVRGRTLTTVSNSGADAVPVSVKSNGAAKIKVVKGPDGGKAVRFPAYTDAAKAPAAALVGTANLSEALDPEDRDFRFGATFSLDAISSGSRADDGDNLLQRGTYSSPGQFKLQVDRRVPSCRVLGSEGALFVKADRKVKPDTWYTASCARDRSGLKLTLSSYGDPESTQVWRTAGPSGQISLAGLPLSVGAKVRPDGVPVASADQFNGAVDNIFVDID